MNGEHHAVAETVVDTPIFAFAADACADLGINIIDDVFLDKALLLECRRKGAAFLGQPLSIICTP